MNSQSIFLKVYLIKFTQWYKRFENEKCHVKNTLYLDIMRTSLAIRDNCLDITSKYLVVTTKKKRSRYNYLVITTIDMVIVRNFLKNIRFNSSIKKKIGLKKYFQILYHFSLNWIVYIALRFHFFKINIYIKICVIMIVRHIYSLQKLKYFVSHFHKF